MLIKLFQPSNNYSTNSISISSIDNFFYKFLQPANPAQKLATRIIDPRNKYLIIASLLDLKRSGDFGQSACVKYIQDTLKRRGVFLTNDKT
jgi:hypothetical protein